MLLGRAIRMLYSSGADATRRVGEETMMEGKINRKAFTEAQEEPRHTRLADVYQPNANRLFQGWGPRIN